MIEHLSASDYAPRPVNYVDTKGMHTLYERMAFRANMVLVGPKGIGKSLSVASYAHKTSTPVITFDCSEDVRRSHLLGQFVLRGNSTPFVLGPLTTAYEIANETGACILILEEINALTPQMQKVLNGSLDFRRRVEVPEAKRVFSLKPDAKLWIVGTMNFNVYGGVYEINEDLKSRVRLLPLDYPTPQEENRIITELVKAQGLKVDTGTIGNMLTLAHETRQKSLDYALSTRDVVQIIEDSAAIGAEKALWLASGKFEGEDRATFAQRVKSIFDIKIAA
jgi:MoxR-like ATPase